MKKILETSLIPRHIQSDIADVMDNKRFPHKLEVLSVREAFDAWLRWNGIIGWTDQILEVVRALDSAEQAATRERNEKEVLK